MNNILSFLFDLRASTMRVLGITLLVSAYLLSVADGGKIMFWMPIGSASMKITYLPLAEELVKRGHEVTIIHPHPMKEKVKGITEIISTLDFNPMMAAESK